MNREEIIKMAKEAGLAKGLADSFEEGAWATELKFLERFAALVAAHEREACILDLKLHTPRNGHNSIENKLKDKLITAIRARGTEK